MEKSSDLSEQDTFPAKIKRKIYNETLFSERKTYVAKKLRSFCQNIKKEHFLFLTYIFIIVKIFHHKKIEIKEKRIKNKKFVIPSIKQKSI